jgi:glucosamine 6-phosphate synthetase-like amidotransferase/phosphosugar isomerase protein
VGVIAHVRNCRRSRIGAGRGFDRPEYRGYDSAGIATLENGRLERRRAGGKLKNLEAKLAAAPDKKSGATSTRSITQSNRRIGDPNARWCGCRRGGAARRLPIPIAYQRLQVA